MLIYGTIILKGLLHPMSTSKQKSNNRKRKPRTSYSKKQEKIQRRQKAIVLCGIIAGVIVFVVWVINSSFWPWPVRDEMDRRLNETIDACMYHETSYACTSAQKKYGLKFEYCHSLSDIPEIDKSIPVYGVARKNNYDMKTSGPYYSCASYLEDVDRNNTENLLAVEPTSYALYSLYVVPKKVIDKNACSISWTGQYISSFWKQVPNYEAIRNEYNIAEDTYSKCNQLDSLQKEYDRINAKFDNYIGNRTVQLFFKYFDDSFKTEPGRSGGCMISNSEGKVSKSLNQGCPGDSGLIRYTRNMRSRMSEYEYTSKVAGQ